MSGNAPATYRQLFAFLTARLESHFESRQLFSHVTGRDSLRLPDYAVQAPLPDEVRLLRELCERRLAGEPLQYLLGEWEFYGLPMLVGPGVLIPRADTETLTETALRLLADIPCAQVLDLCAGTGCVAISIACSRPGDCVTAVEFSEQAYGYLTRNIELNRCTVLPVKADALEYIHPVPPDIIVSNPPYIPAADLAGLQREVLFEPRTALDGGADGLDFYRAISAHYLRQLKTGGWLCFEVGAGQAAAVANILSLEGYRDCFTADDLGGISRVVAARR